MIKTVALLAIILILSFTPDVNVKPPENKYVLTEGQVYILSNTVSVSKQILSNSQAPAITVTQLNNNFDSVMSVLIKQYQIFHPDTTKHK